MTKLTNGNYSNEATAVTAVTAAIVYMVRGKNRTLDKTANKTDERIIESNRKVETCKR